MPNSFSFYQRKMTLIVIICVASLDIFPKFEIQTDYEKKKKKKKNSEEFRIDPVNTTPAADGTIAPAALLSTFHW